MTASIAPAAPNEWPIIPLVELTATPVEKLGDGFAFRRVIERRGRSMGVDVIDLTRLQIPALCNAPSIAWRGPMPEGSGWVR